MESRKEVIQMNPMKRKTVAKVFKRTPRRPLKSLRGRIMFRKEVIPMESMRRKTVVKVLKRTPRRLLMS